MDEITDNTAEERFEMELEGEDAFLTYRRREGTLYLLHTEVPDAMRGDGRGGRLVRYALERARAEGLRVVAFCPFARAYLQRHPEFAELVREEGA